jgi:hypothetical protein
MTQFTDIMLDIETLGVGTNAAIIQIGAVAFNAEGDNPTLWTNSPDALASADQGIRINVDLTRSKYPGEINASTIEWWFKQSDEARASVFAGGPMERMGLGDALQTFVHWINRVGAGRNKVRLWSNGPTFDEMIVRQAFDRYGMDFHQTVSFRNSRCCRTLFDLSTGLGWNAKQAAAAAPDDIVKHDGLGDAVFQARGVVSQMAFIYDKTDRPGFMGTYFSATKSGAPGVEASSGPGEVT